MSRFAKLAPGAFNQIAQGAGMLVTDFEPSTGAYDGILGVTSGGIAFSSSPSYKDYGEDMDNVPKNTMQLKRLDDVEVRASGTFATVSVTLAKNLATATVDSTGAVPKIIPHKNIVAQDFTDLWILLDYSSDISDSTGGFLAIHLINALSTGGFSLQTTDKDKGKFAFEFTAHYDYNDPDTIPYEIYLMEGEALAIVTVASAAGTQSGKTKLTVGGYTPTGGSESYVYKTAATVVLPSKGDSLASGWTAWNGSDEITATTGHEIAVCVKDSHSLAVAGGKTTVVSKD